MEFVEKMINHIINSNNHGEAVGLAKALKEYTENCNTFGKAAITIESIAPNSRISVIKQIREATGLGLKESKELTDVFPSTILETHDKKKAISLVRKLQAVGCKVTIYGDENLQLLYGNK